MSTFLSGVKPTGRPHIGNYFGAMRQFVELQAKFDRGFVMVADLHALNFIQDREAMKQNTFDLVCDYLALGLDPNKVVVFKQSDVPAHTELAWAFDAITTMPYLMRAHAYKDAEAKDKEISVGTFNYPMLMAADILLYLPDVVPVGSDQKQHVEYARDTAEKFNRVFGPVDGADVFALPKELIVEDVATVPGNDGRKMSKSYGNHLELFATDEEIAKFVSSIVTDSAAGVPHNVRAIHSLLRTTEELDALYAEHAGKYKALKDALTADLIAFITPLRAKRAEIAAKPDYVAEVLERGARRANEVAEATMNRARTAMGLR